MIKTFLKSAVFAGLVSAGVFASAQDTDPDEAEVAGQAIAALAEAKADGANWREVDPERLLIFETTKGRVLIETFPELAPKHVAQFTAITRSGDYDRTTFHRVIQGFMAQGGDIFALHQRDSGLPNIEAEFIFRRDPAVLSFDMIGDPDRSRDGYYMGLPVRTQSAWLAELSAEGVVISHIPHCQGVVSTARLGNDENSGNSQFFLMRERSDHLNKDYSPWGRIVAGQDAVQSMKIGEPVLNPDVLISARVAADLEPNERPRVWVQRTDGPIFQEWLSSQETDENVCDLPAVEARVES